MQLHGCEMQVLESANERPACRLIVNGFEPLNSDQCYPFGEPIPVFDDKRFLASLEQK